MAQSFFIWNGRDCRSLGIYLSGPAPIIRPEERVSHIEIPGRAGDLTETEGEDIYNSYIQTVTVHVRGGYKVKEVYRWLRGSGWVTFSGETNRRQKARIIGAVTLNRHSRNIDTWVGEVQFYCQPLKELVIDPPYEMGTAGTIRNYGDVTARPFIRLHTSATDVTLAVGGREFVLTGLIADRWYEIDSETMTVLRKPTGNVVNVTKRSSGAFPTLDVGENTIGGSGWDALEITKRERYL